LSPHCSNVGFTPNCEGVKEILEYFLKKLCPDGLDEGLNIDEWSKKLYVAGYSPADVKAFVDDANCFAMSESYSMNEDEDSRKGEKFLQKYLRLKKAVF
jgi:SpoVK/Ycf46/Vps4 family AAA+-type ATPase